MKARWNGVSWGRELTSMRYITLRDRWSAYNKSSPPSSLLIYSHCVVRVVLCNTTAVLAHPCPPRMTNALVELGPSRLRKFLEREREPYGALEKHRQVDEKDEGPHL